MTADSLAAFLLRMYDEIAAEAHKCAEVYPSPWDVSDRGHMASVKADAPNFWTVTELEQVPRAPFSESSWLGDYLQHIARHDPAYVLADIEAKRRIVARCAGCLDMDIAEDVLLALARPFADHPDFPHDSQDAHTDPASP